MIIYDLFPPLVSFTADWRLVKRKKKNGTFLFGPDEQEETLAARKVDRTRKKGGNLGNLFSENEKSFLFLLNRRNSMGFRLFMEIGMNDVGFHLAQM